MSSEKSWDLKIDRSVFKALKRIPRHDARAIFEAIHLLPVDPFFGDIQKMDDAENSWRRRIGAYRVFYKVKTAEKILLVFRVERRTSKTY